MEECRTTLNLIDFINEWSVDSALDIKKDILKCHRELKKENWPLYAKCVSKKILIEFFERRTSFEESAQIAIQLKGCIKCMQLAKQEWAIFKK